MKLYSWTDDNQSKNPESEFIKPMVLIKISNFATPEEAGAAAAGRMKIDDVLFLRHFGESTAGLPNLGSEPLNEFLIGSTPSQLGWLDYSTRFWRSYKLNGGVQPYRVVLENERGYSWYRIGSDNTIRLNNIEAAISTKKFDKTLVASYNRSILETSYAYNSGGAEWITKYSTYIQNLYNKSLYNIISKPYYAEGYIGNIFSNYNVSRCYKDLVDINGWATKPTSSSYFGYDSPPIYINVAGRFGIPNINNHNQMLLSNSIQAQTDMIKSSKYAFKLAINNADGILKSTRKLPWLAMPRYRGDNVYQFNNYQPFESLISVLTIMGFKEAIYWASPAETQDDRNAVEEILSRINLKYSKGLMSTTDILNITRYPKYDNEVDIDTIDFS